VEIKMYNLLLLVRMRMKKEEEAVLISKIDNGVGWLPNSI
jgi:hypothetical protein